MPETVQAAVRRFVEFGYGQPIDGQRRGGHRALWFIDEHVPCDPEHLPESVG